MKNTLKYLLCFFSGVILATSVSLSGNEHAYKSSSQTSKEFDYSLLLDIFDTIETYYVNDINHTELVQAAIDGVFEYLDPYSDFLSQSDFQSLRESNKGEYFGFGFEVATEKGLITIVTPFKSSPASKAGLKPGDVITHFNAQQVSDENLSMILQQIKQHSLDNQAIHITVKSQNTAQVQEHILLPEHVKIESISTAIIDQVGYINIDNFQEDAAKSILKQAIKWQDIPLKGIIIDVRNNPGGLLDQAVKIADLFLEKGRIVSTQGRYFDANEDYYASNHSVFSNLPMVVLINKGSASASEVLAAALQENNRAELMGETSFGKGTVQSLIPMVGQGNAIKLTIAKYNTPKGNDIHEVGIKPDIKLSSNTVLQHHNMHIISSTNMQLDPSDNQIYSAVNWISQHE